MRQKPSYQITRYSSGSIGEIWSLSWPLIAGLLSNGLMAFVDRIMLGHYSLGAMNAATTASTAALCIFFLPMIIAGISEVFVGRYQGLSKYHMMGSSVWQMIWFSICCTPIFIFIASIGGPILFSNTLYSDQAIDYFKYTLYFGSFYCLAPAIMGFFIGRGKVKLIAVTMLIANLINVGLDYLLIYGTPYSPSMGVKGAAISTVIAQVMMSGIYFYFFMKRKNRGKFGTLNWKIKPTLLITSLKVGFPASIAHVSELLCYFVFLRWMNQLGEEYLTIAVLINSIYMLLYFIMEGVSEGVTAICANLLGASKLQNIKKHLKSCFALHFIFVLSVSAILIFYSEGIFSLFIGKGEREIFSQPAFLSKVSLATKYLCLFYLFDGIVWIFTGMFTAATDTKFIMRVGIIAPWLLFALPTYLGLNYFNMPASHIWVWPAIYSFLLVLIYAYRYRSGRWMKSNILEKNELLDQKLQSDL